MKLRILFVISLVSFWVSLVAIGWVYGLRAVGISCLGHVAIVVMILCEYFAADDATIRENCDGCKHDLGGGRCRMNVEYECREGGGFEMWEDDDT